MAESESNAEGALARPGCPECGAAMEIGQLQMGPGNFGEVRPPGMTFVDLSFVAPTSQRHRSVRVGFKPGAARRCPDCGTYVLIGKMGAS